MNLFETRRLVVSKITQDDASFFLELVNSPEWIRFIGHSNVAGLEGARA